MMPRSEDSRNIQLRLIHIAHIVYLRLDLIYILRRLQTCASSTKRHKDNIICIRWPLRPLRLQHTNHGKDLSISPNLLTNRVLHSTGEQICSHRLANDRYRPASLLVRVTKPVPIGKLPVLNALIGRIDTPDTRIPVEIIINHLPRNTQNRAHRHHVIHLRYCVCIFQCKRLTGTSRATYTATRTGCPR